MLLPIHIAAGGLAIVLGTVALLVKKGGTTHRRVGLLFVYAMLVMGTCASILAFRKSPTDPNLPGGFMVAYFVGTALTTVRPVSRWTRGIDVAALTVAVGLALLDILGGVKAFNSPRGSLNGVPFPMLFFMATVTILAATGDVRIMRFGMPRAAGRAWRAICGGCASRYSSRPDRSSRCVRGSRKSFPSHSRPRRCARCRFSCCLARCSIGCGGSAAAARYQCSCDTIRCHSLLARSEFLQSGVLSQNLPASNYWRA
jgi:hypothetical protein